MRGKAAVVVFENLMERITPAHAGKSNLLMFGFGITPAHAGKSRLAAAGMTVNQDHPRACGEKFYPIRTLQALQGSPPRMRGKVQDYGILYMRYRITPAHAGKSGTLDA